MWLKRFHSIAFETTANINITQHSIHFKSIFHSCIQQQSTLYSAAAAFRNAFDTPSTRNIFILFLLFFILSSNEWMNEPASDCFFLWIFDVNFNPCWFSRKNLCVCIVFSSYVKKMQIKLSTICVFNSD